MNIHFSIEYHVPSGHSLSLVLPQDAHSSSDRKLYTMTSQDGIRWSAVVPSADVASTLPLHFWFCVVSPSAEVVREEWHRVPHTVFIRPDAEPAQHVRCRWQDAPDDDFLYTQMFRRPTDMEPVTPASATGNAVFVRAPHLDEGERLFITGSTAELGRWDLSRALPLLPVDECRWMLPSDCDASFNSTAEAKFVAMTAGQDGTPLTATARWEEGDNRLLTLPQSTEAADSVAELPDVRLPFSRPKLAGTLVPVFSLRSDESAGAGDFGDLYTLVEWAAQTGQSVIQLLPVNDTNTDSSWRNSYPYSSVSVFALHPMYIDLRQLPPLTLSTAQQRTIERDRQQLNSLNQVDYEGVNAFKDRYLRLAFSQQWQQVKNSKEFRQWFKEVQEWLVPYAAYRQNIADCGTADFDKWGKNCRWNGKKLKSYSVIHRDKTAPHYYFFYQQWLLHEQLLRVCRHARELGVGLKCDIGIGVNPQACDVWQHPDLFHRNMQAGAPPDFFSREGQNWGFPTYNWDAMAHDGYRWWTLRLRHMQRYFQAFRLDHVLGFFRIWEIPVPHRDGRMGHFYPALPTTEHIPDTAKPLFLDYPYPPGGLHPRINARETELYHALPGENRKWFDALYDNFFHHRHNMMWYDAAVRKLSALLNTTDMLPCAEDLGMTFPEVTLLMQQMKILSLETETMPKTFGQGEFAPTALFPYHSVCMTSTHDTSPLRLWWEEDAERTQRYADSVLQLGQQAPAHLTPDIASEIIRHYLASPSMLCILPIQDWLALDGQLYRDNPAEERVNDPSNPQHYWRYRMHLTIKQLKNARQLNGQIRQLTLQRNKNLQKSK